MNGAGGSFVAHFYEADHAFFNDERPAVYSAASAQLAWERTLDFLREEVQMRRHSALGPRRSATADRAKVPCGHARGS